MDAGPELSQTEVFNLAEERFTRALAAAATAGDDDIRNLALVGRARARLDLGRTAEALADAELVVRGFRVLRDESAASPRRATRSTSSTGSAR